jgi:hypothetical protein
MIKVTKEISAYYRADAMVIRGVITADLLLTGTSHITSCSGLLSLIAYQKVTDAILLKG